MPDCPLYWDNAGVAVAYYNITIITYTMRDLVYASE